MKRFTILLGLLVQILPINAVIIPDEDIIPPPADPYIPEMLWPMLVDNDVVYKGYPKDMECVGCPPGYSEVIGVTTTFAVENLVIKPDGYWEPKYAVPYAFENCPSIKTASIWRLDEPSRYMFKDCTNLESVDMSKMRSNYDIDYLKIVGIPEGAFYGCVSLSEVQLPVMFDYIGKEAFYGCAGIERIHINETDSGPVNPDEWVVPWIGEFRYIDDEAFAGCTGLKYIKIPASLQKIGDNVWTDCVNLEEILYTAEEPLAVDESKGVFPEVVYDNATLYLSKEYAGTHPDIRDGLGYPWNRFQHIEIMDFSGIDEINSNSENSGNSNEIDQTLPYEVYTLNGTRVCTNNPIPQLQSLPKGLYILRQGPRSKKVVIP